MANWMLTTEKPLPAGFKTSLEPGPRFYYYHKNKKDEKIEEFEEVIYVEDSSGYLWKTMHLLQCKMKLNIPIYAESFNNPSGELFLFD